VAKLHQANLSHETAAAKLDADRPLVQVKALAPIAPEINGKPRPLAAGETAETRVAGEATVVVPGVVEVTVHAAKGLTEAVVARRLELQRLLAEAQVGTIEEAGVANERRKEAERTIRDAARVEREGLRDLTLDLMDEKIRSLQWVHVYPTERPPEPPLALGYEAANDAKAKADRLHQEAETRLDEARRRALTTAGTLERLKAEMAETDVELRLAAEAEQRSRQDLGGARGTDAEVAEAAARADEALRETKAAHDAERDAILALDPKRARAAVFCARALASEARDRLRAAQDEMIAVTARLEKGNQAGLFEQLQEGKTARRHAARERQQLEREALAAKLLFETMSAKRDEAREAYAAPLRGKIVELGRVVFGPSFSVELDEELRIDRRTLDGRTLPFRSLSVGAREQLALLSRLACGLLVDPSEGVPLLFDDTLGHSDPERLASMREVLALAGDRCQVVVLTCTPDRFGSVPNARVIRLGAADPAPNRIGLVVS
jgi:hypothetical protein